MEREIGDSRRSRFLARVLPYRSVDNFIAGVVLTFLDVTATVRAEAEAESASRQMREILESASDAFYTLDHDQRFVYANHRALELWGKREDELIGRSFGEALPSGEFADVAQAQRKALADGAPCQVELEAPAQHGWMEVSIYPSSVGLSVFLRDITQRKRDEARQRLLISELQHRVKNILAVVRSITSRTVERSEGLEDFAAHFDGRLRALARTQAVLARHADAEFDLDEMVREELLSHAAHDGDHIEIDGPSVRLRQKAAEIFALALHELATNAVKYGALSSPSGSVSVTWRIMTTSAGPWLSFEWREAGVAVVDPSPGRTGFGRDLIERGLPYDLAGAVTSIDFAPGGVQCRIELPLDRYAAEVLEFADQPAAGEGVGR